MLTKILVTGSSGFLGSNLIKRLGSNITTYDLQNDPNEILENKDCLKKKLKNIDLVYHLAGISDPNSPDLYKVNVLGTDNLITAIDELKQNTRVVFASSFAVYQIPQKGDIVDEKYPTNPRNEYGKSKLMAEKIVLNNKFNIVMRFSNAFGPGMSSGKHSVISNFIERINNGETLNIYDKNASRDFIYIDDIVDALVMVSKYENTNIFNICSGEETNISNLVSLIEKITKKKARINFSSQELNSGNWRGSFKKARKCFGWKPKVGIETGLKKIINNI